MRKFVIVDFGIQTVFDEFGRLVPPPNRYQVWNIETKKFFNSSSDLYYLLDKYNTDVVNSDEWLSTIDEWWRYYTGPCFCRCVECPDTRCSKNPDFDG